MNRDQLEHAIRAACDVAEDEELWVFGSQAILGQHPEAPSDLRRSMEADVTPRNRPEAVDRIDANLGEASPFHRAHGFYVHGIPIEDAATLPTGWQERAVPVFDEVTTRGNTGWCLEAHDLAASKLAAFRDKDRDFVRLLLVHGMIEVELLQERIENLDIESEEASRIAGWIDRLEEELE